VATLIVLLGGYVGKWSWTGFEANDQVWDWLHLLLLPVALGTVPLWVTYSERMSQARKLIYAVVVVAFIGFVVAGYLVPINWTGFSGNSLWNWLTLIVLPVTLATIRAWPKSAREIRTIHIVVFSALGLAWMVTLLGGYLAKWQWTGYPGNTMWDWLQLLLAPIVISTVLVPAAIRWVSGDVARLAAEEEAKKAAEAAAAARGTASAPAPAQP
jgi:signal transduction histidine kinase